MTLICLLPVNALPNIPNLFQLKCLSSIKRIGFECDFLLSPCLSSIHVFLTVAHSFDQNDISELLDFSKGFKLYVFQRKLSEHVTVKCPTDINNPSSFTWEIGVSKSEIGTNPSLNRGSAEVQTGSTQSRVWIRLVPGEG